MKIAEIYSSRQGEGLLTGVESVFVRASGCNLRCWFCDTPYASWSPEGEQQSVEQILSQVLALKVQHIVLTGGEPLLFEEMVPLTQKLKEAGLHITIETAGTLYLPVACDLMSISPKLANSTPSKIDHPRWSARHDRDRTAPEVMFRLMQEYEYQLKFVVGSLDDCLEVEQYLSQLSAYNRDRVLLMPQGVTPEELQAISVWLEPYCQEQRYVYCPRKHIEWFGYARGV